MARSIKHRQTRQLIALVVGLVGGGVVFAISKQPLEALLAGWDIAALALLGQIFWDFRAHTATQTAALAKRDDMGRSSSDIIVIVASLASLGGVGLLLLSSSQKSLGNVLFGLLSIVISWATVHGLYMLRYAAEYYQGEKAINFNTSKEQPTFSDFAYVAFTIGMTYQVSDTNFSSRAMRKLALGHALLSFVFGTAIIATTINLIASLASGQ